MRNVFRELSLVLLSILLLSTVKLQAQDSWSVVKLNSFYTLEAGQHLLLHPKFFIGTGEAKAKVRTEEVHTALHISKDAQSIYMFTFLAADNPMKWALKILDDTHAEWYDLSCDCNVGLESSIFSNNRNPYKQPIATLTLNTEGGIEVRYAAHFRKDFLDKSSFSNEFFKETYQVYQLQK